MLIHYNDMGGVDTSITNLQSSTTNNTNNIDAMLNNYGSKNLANIRAIADNQELTWILNSNKTITVSGTLATTQKDHVASQVFSLKAGTYIFGKNPMASATTPHTSMSLTNSNGQISYCEVSPEEEEKEFVLSSDAEVRIWLNCIGRGSTFNVTFYPMIRDARITDDTYTPYAMTNRELTNRVQKKVVNINTNNANRVGQTGLYETHCIILSVLAAGFNARIGTVYNDEYYCEIDSYTTGEPAQVSSIQVTIYYLDRYDNLS